MQTGARRRTCRAAASNPKRKALTRLACTIPLGSCLRLHNSAVYLHLPDRSANTIAPTNPNLCHFRPNKTKENFSGRHPTAAANQSVQQLELATQASQRRVWTLQLLQISSSFVVGFVLGGCCFRRGGGGAGARDEEESLVNRESSTPCRNRQRSPYLHVPVRCTRPTRSPPLPHHHAPPPPQTHCAVIDARTS
jgi:hypothetical protein